jgi:hypothetical protein
METKTGYEPRNIITVLRPRLAAQSIAAIETPKICCKLTFQRAVQFLRGKHIRTRKSERLKNQKPSLYRRVAGQRARDPPDPIPNSEVKPRSVSGASVVFGHVKPEKLAALL